ncbi:MAG: heavy metal-associated domain-containing protein [Sphaerochaetaceae bacterium]|nr:heavy metal-associated domain-containing protein [Sphaerochaetaceae bacterium]
MKTTIHTKGMSCHHCEERVCKAVKNQKGVQDCTADAKTGDVVVTHDDGLDIFEIETLIDDIGYEVVK